MDKPKRSFAFAQSDVDNIVESIDAKANEFADPVAFVELLQSELAYLKSQLRKAQEEYEREAYIAARSALARAKGEA